MSSVEDPAKEREEWKEHFRKIQEGQGKVKGRVWNNVGPQKENQRWMGEEPTDAEVDIAVGEMANGKAAGEDQLLAEMFKYGGKALRKEIAEAVRSAWREAAYGEGGEEARGWPEAWKVAIQIPIWKQKGSRSDKNTFRGITLLSVGTKVLARVVSARVQRWSEEFLADQQAGFRRNRGVDDALQVTRRVAETVVATAEGAIIRFTFHDLEKAYPRVCRPALWEVMEIWGADERLVNVCKALHNHTTVKVRMYGDCSSRLQPRQRSEGGMPVVTAFVPCVSQRSDDGLPKTEKRQGRGHGTGSRNSLELSDKRETCSDCAQPEPREGKAEGSRGRGSRRCGVRR